ncbi:MAG: hypothetical protein JXB23_00095 [Candidatus Aminicenantes bacterium]|nr:hypothetical protein [Candidatus Aminicenantes bacterium]
MKFLKVLLNSLISGLFFSGLLALLILDLNCKIDFSFILLGQFTLFNSVTYGILITFACISVFFISQFFSVGSYKIKLISPSFLMISFSLVLAFFLVILRQNMKNFASFFSPEIGNLLETQFLVLLFLVFLGAIFLYAYLYYKKKKMILAAYFLCFGAIIGYSVYLRTTFPAPVISEKVARLEAKSIDKKVTIIGMQGLSFDFIIPLINQDKLPNFAWLMEEGSWGRLESFSPNDLIVLNTSVNTGKLPAKHNEFSPATHRLLYIPQKIEVIPRFIFFTLLRRIGLLESFPRSPKYFIKDIWKIFEENGISYLKQDPLYCGNVSAPSENVQAAFNRFMKDYRFENLEIGACLQQALLCDMDRDERFMQEKVEMGPQLCYLLLVGLNLVESYFYKYNFPDMFGAIEQEEITGYGSVIDNYYKFYDQIIGKHLASMKEDELILVYSPHGIEPLPVWKRLLHWIFGDAAVSAHHEGAPEGVFYFYGKNIAHGKQVEGMRLIDITPTLLNYLELPVGKDMDGIVNSSMFDEDFKIGNPVLYISSYEEVEINRPQ